MRQDVLVIQARTVSGCAIVYHSFSHLVIRVNHHMVIGPGATPHLGSHDNCGEFLCINVVRTKTGYVGGPMHIEPVAIAESSAGFGTGIGMHIQQLTMEARHDASLDRS